MCRVGCWRHSAPPACCVGRADRRNPPVVPLAVTRVDCHQLAPEIGQFAPNQSHALAAIRRSAAAGADVVVLPELVTSGYMFESEDEARALAITPADDALAGWASAAGEAIVIGGFAELAADGRIYNSAAILDHTGLLAVYRKIHLWDQEKLFFSAGSEAPPILDTRVGRLAVVICYDLEFPELTRAVALAGADLIAAPTNWPLADKPVAERAGVVGIAMATARVNGVAIACCDRSGPERGQLWTEGTCVIDQEGWIAATPDETGLATAEIDLTRSRRKRLTSHADLFADRRPEVYARLAAGYPQTG
jgi:predicted amidohydrolase